MSTSLLHGFHTAWSSQDPRVALKLSQQAPAFLKSQPARAPSFPLSLFVKSETAELWLSYEKLFLACLRTGDDLSAKECLSRLTERFGTTNERIMGLYGLYEEATAENKAALEEILKSYEEVLEKNPVNVTIAKRRISLLRSLDRSEEAIKALVGFLEAFPTDGEAWVELSDMYESLGMFPQAIHSLEEALLNSPNAWNLHARFGELLYKSAASAQTDTALKYLSNSVQHFCRSIELCDNYIRGYYGLKLSTTRLLEIYPSGSSNNSVDTLAPSDTICNLEKLAVSKLGEIVAKQASKGQLTEEIGSDIIAAKQLLEEHEKTRKH